MMNHMQGYVSPRKIVPIKNFDCRHFEDLKRIGIGLDSRVVEDMMASRTLRKIMSYAADAIQPTITTASMATPIQFLQNWLPGFVEIETAARKIDVLVGINTSGAWEDEQVVQTIMEQTGTSVPYGDYTNIPLSSWNTNFEYRTVVRFEEGMMVGREEEARAARMRVDSASMKRESCALALEIIRNSVGFYGYNNGLNRTYGFLNDPSLSAYVNVPNGASGSPLFLDKTPLEQQADLLTGLAKLRTQSQDRIDPKRTPITLAVATNAVDALAKSSDFNISTLDWLAKNYPLVRIESAPELNGANGGASVFYLYAERVEDSSTDGGLVFLQNVPSKFQLLGVEQLAKAYKEDYSNATAGIMVKRPFAVVRYSGI